MLTVQNVKTLTIADMTGTITLGNSSGGTVTALATDIVRPSDWNSTLAFTANFNFGSGLSSTTNTNGLSVGIASVGYFEPYPAMQTNSSLSAPGIGTWYIHPFNCAGALGSGQINMLMADVAGFLHGNVFSAASTGSVSRYQTLRNIIALYKLGSGASTTRIESIWSADCSFLATQSLAVGTANTSSGTITNALTLSFPAQWDASGGVTYSTTGSTGTTAMTTSTMASTRANNLITGAQPFITGSRMNIHPFATSLSAGNYWFGHMMTSTSSTTGTAGGVGTAGTLWSTQSRVYMLEFVDQAYKRLGLSVSNTSTVVDPFHGSVATTSSAPFATLGTADIRNQVTNARVYWNYLQSSY